MTGEELWIIAQPVFVKLGYNKRSLGDMGEEVINFYDTFATILDQYYLGITDTTDPTPYPPSNIPPIRPLPKDISWGQFYPEDLGYSAEEIKRLYNKGDSKDKLLASHSRLSLIELDKILATL